MSGFPSRVRYRYKRFNDTVGIIPQSGWTKVPLGTVFLDRGGGDWAPIPGHSYFAETMNSVMSGESCVDELHKGPPWTDGGPFTRVYIEMEPHNRVEGVNTYYGPTTQVFWGFGQGPIKYVGGFLPMWTSDWDIPSYLKTGLWAPSVSDYYLKAYQRTRPRLESASGFVFGAEIRDIPRMLKTTAHGFAQAYELAGGSPASKIMSPKKAADHFLNHQFGWVPFLSDLQKFQSTFQNHAAIKSRLTHDNDKWKLHRASLAEFDQTIDSYRGTGMQVVPGGYLIQDLFRLYSNPSWEVTHVLHSSISACGSYKYYRPEFDASLPDYDSAWNAIQRDLVMYGARISPSNVYRATPWTWLADWFTDFGSVVDAVTDAALDGIVAKYLYVMRHDQRRYTFKQVLPFRSGDVTFSWSAKVDAKKREQAGSPYGFGLSWNTLTPRQIAICAALGITRW